MRFNHLCQVKIEHGWFFAPLFFRECHCCYFITRTFCLLIWIQIRSSNKCVYKFSFRTAYPPTQPDCLTFKWENFVYVQNSPANLVVFKFNRALRKKNFTRHFIYLFFVIACDVFFYFESWIAKYIKMDWSIVKFNPVFMLSECKASAQYSTNFNQNFWSRCSNTISLHPSTSLQLCRCSDVSILFSLFIQFCHVKLDQPYLNKI